MVKAADIAAPIVVDPRNRAYPRVLAAVVDELAVEFLRGRGKSRGAKKRGERDESFGLRRSRAFSRKRRASANQIIAEEVGGGDEISPARFLR